LHQDPATGEVSCLILVTLPKPGDETICTSGSVQGLQGVDPNVLANFRAAQKAIWTQQGGMNSGLPNPDTLPVCQLTELTPMVNPTDFDATGSCQGSMDPGWCYVEGQAAGT